MSLCKELIIWERIILLCDHRDSVTNYLASLKLQGQEENIANKMVSAIQRKEGNIGQRSVLAKTHSAPAMGMCTACIVSSNFLSELPTLGWENWALERQLCCSRGQDCYTAGARIKGVLFSSPSPLYQPWFLLPTFKVKFLSHVPWKPWSTTRLPLRLKDTDQAPLYILIKWVSFGWFICGVHM
jgi:hypothetical protein